jgi:16S rRNA (cytidine1402-2'-O)-methyltransferase
LTGRLVLVGTPLGNLGDLSPRAVQALAEADLVACEDTRRTGKLLELAGVHPHRLAAVHEHNEASMVPALLARLERGETVALVSDAGMPVISDPGARLVKAAAAAGHDVTTVPGPSAGVAALAISGLPSERWAFEGFLPRKGRDRAGRLDEIAGERRTVVLYEAPHRIGATLDDLRRTCGPDRPVVIARELTKRHEEIWRGTLGTAAVEQPRGEYVVVLGGAPESEEVSDDMIAAALEQDTVAAVARGLGVSRNRVYAVARQAGKGVGAGADDR